MQKAKANQKQTNNVRIRNIEPLCNSVNGNPRFSVLFYCIDTIGILRGKTATGAMFTYCMPNLFDEVVVTWHKTKKGNVIIDDIKTIE